MEENKMKKHVTIVAAFRIGLGFLGLIGISIAWFAVAFAMDFVPLEDVPEFVVPFVKGIVGFIFIIVALLSILGIIGGIGLLTFRSWARILTLVVSAISCLNIPIGTLVGVYSIWVLVQDETKQLFVQ
jgi:hypothetical protein